jgi:hypothetical protein
VVGHDLDEQGINQQQFGRLRVGQIEDAQARQRFPQIRAGRARRRVYLPGYEVLLLQQ